MKDRNIVIGKAIRKLKKNQDIVFSVWKGQVFSIDVEFNKEGESFLLDKLMEKYGYNERLHTEI